MTVVSQRAHWARLLRLLDVETAGEAVGSDADLLNEAKAMVRGGYREILRLAESGAGTA